MKTLKVFWVLVLSLILISCDSKEESIKPDVYDFYLDFEKEASALNQMNMVVEKAFSDNGQKDSLEESPNWNEEFRLFIESDVNHKPISEQYVLQESKRGDTLIYELIKSNKEPGVQSAVHYFLNDQLVKVSIEVENSDLLRKSHYQLTYLPRRYYSIDARVEIPFLLERNVSIEAWMKP